MSKKCIGRFWRKKELEKLCRKITNLPVKIYFRSFKWTRMFVAMASETLGDPWIVFAARKFREPLIWHECSHLLFYNDKIKSRTRKEFNCQVRAVQFALDCGRVDMANRLIENTEDWKCRPHKKAGEMVRKYFMWRE